MYLCIDTTRNDLSCTHWLCVAQLVMETTAVYIHYFNISVMNCPRDEQIGNTKLGKDLMFEFIAIFPFSRHYMLPNSAIFISCLETCIYVV
jgi:hypothetical protein